MKIVTKQSNWPRWAFFSWKKSRLFKFSRFNWSKMSYLQCEKCNFRLKISFLGVKMQMFHIFTDLKFNIIFEFWCKNQDKLTSNILSKMNFWTKICVLIQCVHQPSRISFWLLYCNDKNCATLVSKTIEQNTVKNHAWIFQIEQKNWSKIMLFNALWKSTNNCVLCDLSKIELNSIKNWGLLVWNSGLAYFLVDIDIRQEPFCLL